jgi:hypothetical protein
MMKLLKSAGTVGAVISFARSPAGRQLIEQIAAFAGDPRTRAAARQFTERLRAGGRDPRIVDEARPGPER